MAAANAVQASASTIFGSALAKPARRSAKGMPLGKFKIVAKFDLKPPPYELDALEPHISKATLEVHWGKHHRAYVDNLNKQVEGTDLEKLPLPDVIKTTYANGTPTAEFNNAGQAWNHEFYWEGMKNGGGGKPTGELLKAIETDFGSFEAFVDEFKKAGATQFGSGWAWLVYDGKLKVNKTPNAVTPLVYGETPLLTMDVWEHAYYLDVQNRRPAYIDTFVDKLINWDVVAQRYQQAKLA